MSWYRIGVEINPSWRGRPQQMLAPDIPLWYSYLSKHEDEYEKLLYNFALTTAEPENVPYAASLRDMWMYSISKRLDVVGIRKDENIDIFEVTSSARVRAAGQMMIYRWLWEKVKPLPKQPKFILLCTSIDIDVEKYLNEQKFTILKEV